MSAGDDNSDIAEVVTEELFHFCKSTSLSEEGLRDIIERHGHGLTPRNNIDTLVSNYGFFLWACCNERVDEGIIRLLLEYVPDAINATTHGSTPLHSACLNPNPKVTLNIIQLLIDAAPDSVRSVNNNGSIPLHSLCDNDSIDGTAAMEILKLLIEKYPESVQHATNKGRLPIHYAAGSRSPEFCQVLIEEYPGSERLCDAEGELPLHRACRCNIDATIKYLHKLYPDAINHADTDEMYPIHYAMDRVSDRDLVTGAVETVQFLLDCDPNVKFQKWQGKSLLCAACLQTNNQEFNDSILIVAAIEVIKAFYDAHPEAIEEQRITQNFQRYHVKARAFINSELIYARQAKDLRLMNTPDDNGRLPLHTALQNNASLGSIKLLVKGNPSAIRNFDDSGAIPLHVACEHHESASVVKYLVSLADITLNAIDGQGNTALHYACRGAKYDTIALLLDKFDAVSVSKRNADGKLPIDLLWESNEVLDRESVAYTERVYRLLRAYPETTMRIGLQAQSVSVSSPSPSPTLERRGNLVTTRRLRHNHCS